jgi:hypothetical protein
MTEAKIVTIFSKILFAILNTAQSMPLQVAAQVTIEAYRGMISFQ